MSLTLSLNFKMSQIGILCSRAKKCSQKYAIDHFCQGFFFQAEDGIRDPLWSRGLGDVYKRQGTIWIMKETIPVKQGEVISEKLAGLLSKLDIKAIEAGIALNAALEEGLVYQEAVSYTHLTLPTICSV